MTTLPNHLNCLEGGAVTTLPNHLNCLEEGAVTTLPNHLNCLEGGAVTTLPNHLNCLEGGCSDHFARPFELLGGICFDSFKLLVSCRVWDEKEIFIKLFRVQRRKWHPFVVIDVVSFSSVAHLFLLFLFIPKPAPFYFFWTIFNIFSNFPGYFDPLRYSSPQRIVYLLDF